MPTAQNLERTILPARRRPWLLGVPRRVAVRAIRGYQYFLSPFFGQHCRFHPTCSNYAIEALQRFGALRGGWMTLRRLARCHPWCSGGVDLVPAPRCELERNRDPARC